MLVTGGVHLVEAESLRMQRDVLITEKMGGETFIAEEGGGVRYVGVDLPVETLMGQPHHPVVVRIEPGGQAGPAGAALRRGREGSIEPDPTRRQQVEVRARDLAGAVTMQVATEIMRGHDDDVSRHRRVSTHLGLQFSWAAG